MNTAKHKTCLDYIHGAAIGACVMGGINVCPVWQILPIVGGAAFAMLAVAAHCWWTHGRPRLWERDR